MSLVLNTRFTYHLSFRMKFTFDVCLSENSISNLKFFQSGSRVSLWKRNLPQAGITAITPKTRIRKVCARYTRLQPVTPYPSYSDQTILTLSAKSPSLLPVTWSHAYLIGNKCRWALVAWRLYRYYFIQINILTTPQVFSLANYFTLGVRHFIHKSSRKLPIVCGSTTFQTYNL